MKINYIFNLLLFFTNLFAIKKYLHIFQLKNYNINRYLRYFCNFKSIIYIFSLTFLIIELFIDNILFSIIIKPLIYIYYLIYLKNLIKTSKTPLKFTKKLSRLLLISIFILFSFTPFNHSFLLCIASILLLPAISHMLNFYDKMKNKKFIKNAVHKIKTSSAKIIAITGSNGKTGVKNILIKMLSTEHTVQASPESFNTPIGIAKFINESLKKDTKFIILEYGARRKNDISKLCQLFGADYGIITTISSQHLETFKTIENIYQAKQELSNHLASKPCVFNIDNIFTKRMYIQKNGEKISASINQKSNVFANNIKFSNFTTSFNLHINTKSYNLQTKLLGQHNILNICLATALSKYIGIKDENIISAINNLKPTDHRLSFIKTNINILDDTYNCSPLSAKESLLVLQQTEGKKMVCTPGIIECGKEKYNINFNLGKEMYFCDFCIIVGKENKQALLDGIKSQSLKNKNHTPKVYLANTLDDAKNYFNKLHSNDTLLLLNDLPDDYK